MKYVLLMILLTIVSCDISLKDDSISIKELSPASILTSIYEGKLDGSQFILDSENPEYETLEGSYDDSRYINLDTILHYSNDNDLFAAAVVINPVYSSSDFIQDCHACAPIVEVSTFKQLDTLWHLQKSRGIKNPCGQYGEVGQFKVLDLGEGLPCIEFDSGEYSGQGYTSGIKKYYSLVNGEGFMKVFEYQYISDSTDAYGDEGKKEVSTLTFDSSLKHPDLTVTTIDLVSKKKSLKTWKYDSRTSTYQE